MRMASFGEVFLCLLRICVLRLPFLLNFFLHILHWKGFSPVCVRICSARCDLLVKGFSQI